jgi:hypothetical protein
VIARRAASRHGVFSRADAVRGGASRGLIQSRVRTGRWETLFPGVYRLAGAPESWLQTLRAACLAVGLAAAASHRSAGAVSRLIGFGKGPVEISVPRGRRVRLRGVIVHEVVSLPSVDVTVVDAIPVTTATRTLIDLAAVVPADLFEEALDDALRRRLTTVPHLQRRINQLGTRGRPGLAVFRRLIAARAETGIILESPLETRFLRLLRRVGLPMPACQFEIRDRGRLVARVDFAYPEIRLAVEVDGYRWHSGRASWERDLARRNALTSLGWRVIHVTYGDIRDRPERTGELIAEALIARKG